MAEGVNLSMIYFISCKNFCKCRNEFPPNTTIKKKNRRVKPVEIVLRSRKGRKGRMMERGKSN
jgi:hypothetical protein